MKQRILIALSTVFLLICLQTSAEALTQKKTLEDLTAEANLIVIGTVTDKTSYFDKEGMIQTEVLVRREVQVSKKGPADPYIKVVVNGGEIGDVGMLVSDSPSFNIGETVLLFLSRKSKRYIPVGADQGKLTLIGNRIVERDENTNDLLNQVFDFLESKTEISFEKERAWTRAFIFNAEQTIQEFDKASTVSAQVSQCTNLTGVKWSRTSVGFTIGADIPFSWISPIAVGASAWNQAGSKFRFTADNQGNTISFRNFGTSSPTVALTTVTYNTSTRIISKVITQFNSAKDFSTTGATGRFDVQDTMAHEFGHWLFLGDIYTSSCSQVTMYGYSYLGSTYRRTLEPADKEGIISIYGR